MFHIFTCIVRSLFFLLYLFFLYLITSLFIMFFFFKQKTAYEMRISDWSSDVCSSDLHSCSLCEIAYHTVTPKHDWKSYKAGLGIPIQELYKNQLTDEQRHCIAGEYPAVLGKLGEQYVRLDRKSAV